MFWPKSYKTTPPSNFELCPTRLAGAIGNFVLPTIFLGVLTLATVRRSGTACFSGAKQWAIKIQGKCPVFVVHLRLIVMLRTVRNTPKWCPPRKVAFVVRYRNSAYRWASRNFFSYIYWEKWNVDSICG